MKGTSTSIESGNEFLKFDDDGRIKRTGTMLTASAHIITAVIGSGVLSLAWAFAQLGWVAGPLILMAFAVITWFTSILQADCYRSSDGTRNKTYKEVVRNHLGVTQEKLCSLAQYTNLVGGTIGYMITPAISTVAITRAICFHKHGHGAGCHTSNNPFIIGFGVLQLILSQIPNFHKLSFLSIIAAVMSFFYSSIGLGLSIARVSEGGHVEKGLTGIPVGPNLSSSEKMWNIFNALGNIAFAYMFSGVLIEIQDTIKSGVVPENKVMNHATLTGITISTIFYMLCGVLGYAAFGNDAPGNFLTGFGFYEPYWLVAFANLCIAIHLVGSYQVFVQPIYGAVENWSQEKWSGNKFITREYSFGNIKLSLFRLVWRSGYVIFTTIISMLFPFFTSFVGLIGAVSFWPLTVYFPVQMYIARANIQRFSTTWISMQILSGFVLIIAILSAAGSIKGLVTSVRAFKPFGSVS